MVVTRSFYTAFNYPGAATAASAYISFSPTQLPSWTGDFTNTFELVKVLKAKVQFFPAANVVQQSSGQALAFAPMLTAYTTDQAVAPTSANQVLSYNTFRPHTPYATWSEQYNPTVAVALNSGNQYDLARNVWQSIGSNPQTNGLLVWLDVPSGVAAATFVGYFVVSITFAVSNSY